MLDLDAHVFGLPPGVDFAAEVVAGLEARLKDAPPALWAQVEIWANTPRMMRRIRAAFENGPPRLMPKLRVLSDIDATGLPPAVPSLRRRLDLAQLVTALIDTSPGIAPRESAFALADSLAALLDEMQGEGVSAEAIADLDVSDQSGHWARALEFLRIAQAYTSADNPDSEGRRRMAVERLAAQWEVDPPQHPVIVAGSTGSRGTTALFMAAVARLPQGAIILPGFDTTAPHIWASLSDARAAEDHPQYRFRKFADLLGMDAADIPLWTAAAPPNAQRNALVSLALRPAPVTDQWIKEGPALGDLIPAMAGVTLLEAPSPRIEAEAIALRLRHAVEKGQRATLISPDRMLTRQVAAALDRWRIKPDDSAGMPLALSPPGRFLRQIADLRTDRVSAEGLIALLKHPLTHTGADRGAHLLATQKLEISLRKYGPAYPDRAAITKFAQRLENDRSDKDTTPPEWPQIWAAWLSKLIDDLPADSDLPLATHLTQHLALAETCAAGAGQEGAGVLWAEAAGRAARAKVDELQRHADAGASMDPFDYARLFHDLVATGEVRDRDSGHPLVRILGAREAREADGDLIILGALNDGTWPKLPPPDPWLNRAMRLRAGMLLPERQVGLAAHDFQQAVAAPEVWLTRSVKSDSAETVASRWLARLTNLLTGLPAQGGKQALDAMRAEGARWIKAAHAMSQPEARVDPEPRPSPAPPADMRPKRLSVTTVERLLRDPYAVYAQEVLKLRPLDPLTMTPDAPLRGTILHRVFEEALAGGFDPYAPDAARQIMLTAEEVLLEDCPWPLMRRLWLARIGRIVDWFIEGERDRQTRGKPAKLEGGGKMLVPGTTVEITVKTDRIDMTDDNRVIVYDYKTGKPPSVKQQGVFDKQLLLTAALVEQGAFHQFGPREVMEAAYIGLGTSPSIVPAPLDEHPPAKVWAELATLLKAWADPARGYTARMALLSETSLSNYDHLSRFGEWDKSSTAVQQVLT